MMTQTIKPAQAPLWPVLRVLCWEFMRCLPVLSFVWLLCGLLLPWLLFRAVMNVGSEHFYESANCYPVFYGLTASLGFAGVYQAQKGVRQFLSTLPLTTEFMFAWLLGVSLAAVCVTYVAANALVQFVYGVDWPWVRPLLWLVFFVAYAHSAYWRLMVGYSWKAVLAAFGLAVVSILCFGLVQGGREINPSLPLSALELSLLAFATFVTVSVGYSSFRTMRATCADRGSDVWLEHKMRPTDLGLIEIATTAGPKANKAARLTGTKAAFDWISYRMIGIGVLSGAVLVGVAGIAAQLAASCEWLTFKIVRPHYLVWVTGNVLILFCFAIGVAMGLLIAGMMRMPGGIRQTTMSAFHGTRPVSNAELWRVLGKAMFRYGLYFLVVVVVLLSIVPLAICTSEGFAIEKTVVRTSPNGTEYLVKSRATVLAGLQQNPLYNSFGMFSIAAWVLLGFLVMWTTASLIASCMFFGNDRGMAYALGIAGVFLMAMMPVVSLTRQSQRAMIVTTIWTTAGIGALAATCWAFRRALRERLLTERQLYGAVLLWALLAAIVVKLVATEHIPGAMLLSSLASLGVAAGPVGLTASRHR